MLTATEWFLLVSKSAMARGVPRKKNYFSNVGMSWVGSRLKFMATGGGCSVRLSLVVWDTNAAIFIGTILAIVEIVCFFSLLILLVEPTKI
jgi:hypothetical protein